MVLDRIREWVALGALAAPLLCSACTERTVTGEGQFSRAIALASDPSAPLPRLVWLPGPACPGEPGICQSYCTQQPALCDANACMPLLIDSGTPISILPLDEDGPLSFGEDCVELRAAGRLLDAPSGAALEASSAAFRLLDAPIVRAPRSGVAGWSWEIGGDTEPEAVGGVIGGNVLRDFAIELRHREGEEPSVAFFTEYPGTEAVLGDQGRAYIRLQYPGRLLGRLLNDHCEIGDGLDCRLSGLALSQTDQQLLFESTRALVDACVAPPPCVVEWTGGQACELNSGGPSPTRCSGDPGGAATLVVATGVPGLVLFEDSATQLLGDLDQLPSCAGSVEGARACAQDVAGALRLPGWPPLTGLRRVRVRALGLVEGLAQPSGAAPCERLRSRLSGLVRQCRAFASEGRPVRPTGAEFDASALVIGEVGLTGASPDPTAWLEATIVPATAAPVLALRREVVPEGAQPDGLIGGALLRNTETVLDFTEPIESPGLRVRCLDPGSRCLAAPACEADLGTVDLPDSDAGRPSCCFGLPVNLIAEVVLGGEDKQVPRVEDVCCSALPAAALIDLQSPGLDLCTGVDLP